MTRRTTTPLLHGYDASHDNTFITRLRRVARQHLYYMVTTRRTTTPLLHGYDASHDNTFITWLRRVARQHLYYMVTTRRTTTPLLHEAHWVYCFFHILIFSYISCIIGIGTGAGSSIFGFLTRSTVPEDRATVFAAVMACRQAGLLIGPAFNIFLRLCDFHIGPFVVNKYTAPGLFMCLLWILLQLAVFFMYWDLPPLEKGNAKHKPKSSASSDNEQGLMENAEEEGDEGKPLMGSQELMGSYGSVVTSDPQRNHISAAASNPSLNHISAFLREEVIVLLAAQFITLFNQTALETMVTPLTQKYFSYGELENSVMYCLCGVEVIAGFLFVRWLSRRVAERVVLAIGLAICNISCVWCLIFLANPLGGFPWQLTEFIIGVFLQVLGLPFVAVAQVSLFSKVTAEKTQGFSQGVRRSVGGLATILGPLWAGGLTDNMYIMMGVMMGLLAMLTVSCLCLEFFNHFYSDVYLEVYSIFHLDGT
uniref:Major facilitator superfamily (MFS) profile domain-containing protein n=1 Tax=Sphaeramia orbicularis TaxID=375764 RepID=A0A672YRM4_9TELE